MTGKREWKWMSNKRISKFFLLEGVKTQNFGENRVVRNSKLEIWHLVKNHHFLFFACSRIFKNVDFAFFLQISLILLIFHYFCNFFAKFSFFY